MTDPERLDDYTYYINWHADAKPVYRIRWRVIALMMVVWTVCFLVYWWVLRGG